MEVLTANVGMLARIAAIINMGYEKRLLMITFAFGLQWILNQIFATPGQISLS